MSESVFSESLEINVYAFVISISTQFSGVDKKLSSAFSSVINLAFPPPKATAELNFLWGLAFRNTDVFLLKICFLSCHPDRSAFLLPIAGSSIGG